MWKAVRFCFGVTLAAAAAWSGASAPAIAADKAAQSAKPAASSAPRLRIHRVGPNRKLKLPSAAARVARSGDRIEIDAGEYRDCAVWRAGQLTIKGIGGYAHVRDVSCENKGIWVIKGANTRISRIEFSGAHASHNNGAGIRLEGSNLLALNSYFHDNENGILAGRRPRSRIFIRNSIFERNGKCAPDCAHGIYIGHVALLVVTGSTFRNQRVGHHIKSRAAETQIVGNRILDGLDGTASFSINLPNGGTATIRSNSIQQGPRAENYRTMIAIGEEGATNRSRGILIEQNVFTNSHRGATVFVRNRTRQPAVLRGNRFSGPGEKLEGPGSVR